MFARSHQAGRPEDQDEHQQQIGHDRRDLRDGHVPDVEQRAAGRRRDADAAEARRRPSS